MKKKALLLIFTLVFVLFLTSGCTQTGNGPEIPTLAGEGGFRLETENLSYTCLVSGSCRYASCQFATRGQSVVSYTDGVQTLILFTNGGVTYYYLEAVEGPASYAHPLAGFLEQLKEASFDAAEDGVLDGVTYRVYSGSHTVSSQSPLQIDYTRYTVAMDWPGEPGCQFRYYVYSNGSTLISAEAPNEINPIITPDTPWYIDDLVQYLINRDTGERLPLELRLTESGKALPPSGAEYETVEQTTQYTLYTDPASGALRRILLNEKAMITLLGAEGLSQPEITADMLPMPEDLLQSAYMLLSAVEALI